MSERMPQQIVDAYLDAIEAGDFEQARACLADRNFEYVSPVLNSGNADEFINNISHVGAILQRIERRHVFVDGEDICHIIRFFTSWSTLAVTDTVLWCTVKDGKIKRIETFFDARAYREMFIQDGEE